MAVASASKSITAAAVVREMNLKGLPLTTPFSQVAGINHPAMASVPTVLDVLRNIGGFNDRVDSYDDHAMIDASVHGEYPITGEMMYNYMTLGGHIDMLDTNSYWDRDTYNKDQQDPTDPDLRYSNPGYTMLGEVVRIQSGQTYEDYVRLNLLLPINLQQEIYPDPGHRNQHVVPTKVGLRSYLINDKHPYITIGCRVDADCALTCSPNAQNCIQPPPTCSADNVCLGCSANVPCDPGWTCDAGACVNLEVPAMKSEPVPPPKVRPDKSPVWATNAGPVEASAPRVAASERYAGKIYLGGAALAAGGWYGDGAALATFIRVMCQSGLLMSQQTSAQLWSPQWWNQNHEKGPGWSYGLGWWIRGNWVAMAGGTDGAASIVVHNRAYDFTVVYLTNLKGNPLGDLMNVLMKPTNGAWGTSTLGLQFPCIDDISTASNECQLNGAAY